MVSLHRSAFINELRARFPTIGPWLAGNRDNLTMEMIRFRHFTEDAIARGDLSRVREAFLFLSKAFTTGNRHLRNSVVVSFLEHLRFTGPKGASAEQLLPAVLAAERTRMLAALAPLARRGSKRRRAKGAT